MIAMHSGPSAIRQVQGELRDKKKTQHLSTLVKTNSKTICPQTMHQLLDASQSATELKCINALIFFITHLLSTTEYLSLQVYTDFFCYNFSVIKNNKKYFKKLSVTKTTCALVSLIVI